MIQVLVQQKRVPQKRRARHADGIGGKDVSFLPDKVLRAIILAHGKAGHVGPHRRKRIGRWPAAVHVAEIQRVGAGKIMIEAHAELVVILAQGLGSDESIGAGVGQREKRKDVGRDRVDWPEQGHLVERHRHAKKGELLLSVIAQAAAVEAGGAFLAEVALPFRHRWYGGGNGFALAVAEALVISEEERLVLNNGAAEGCPKLVLLQGLNAAREVV